MAKLLPTAIRVANPFNSQQVRWLPRWSHRRPLRIIPAEHYDKTKDTYIPREKEEPVAEPQAPIKINWKQPNYNSFKLKNEKTDKHLEYKLKTHKAVKPLTISKNKELKTSTDMLEAIIDKDGNFVYTKMKDNDTRISAILVEIKSKKEKEKKDLILLEGKRLIKDALIAGCKLEYILFSRMQELNYIKPFLPKLGAQLYKMPYREIQMWSDLTTSPGLMGIFKIPDANNVKSAADFPLTIICDNIREPNNLGSVLRICSGVGCKQVILTKGCVNVWDTKVLRSAMGAHFKLNIERKSNWLGIRSKIDSFSSIYIADNHLVSIDPGDTMKTENNLEELLQAVPVLPYYSVDFRIDKHIVLVIGGETEGISKESYELASDLKGVRLNIPLSNDIESLNAGTALGIIAFEIKRQLLMLQNQVEESKV
ncbi:hypothetical protein NQ318_009397 [Aromia moschata]|uniref:tRNA/rRNA methyltransferase SpoU type domain-containing protein n=1 Tax=Aromia moschata TaxID=1265417 RepID=A0AAV8Z813_9CUCU|nr:hypothetical protein NQ318_009397 [Aromia moschata]